MEAKNPGKLVQVDHMIVQIPGFGYVKHFSTTCTVIKYAVYQVYQETTSKNAAGFLDYIQQSLPFAIKCIQVDGESKFMVFFENACKKAKISLFVLPPRYPKLNGNIERSNGTAKYEFYAQYTADSQLHIIKKKLQKFYLFYNFERPHQGINPLTPSHYFETINVR